MFKVLIFMTFLERDFMSKHTFSLFYNKIRRFFMKKVTILKFSVLVQKPQFYVKHPRFY